MGYNLPAPSGLNVWELEGVTAEGVVAEDAAPEDAAAEDAAAEDAAVEGADCPHSVCIFRHFHV